jgi:hypothetical protein
VRIPPLLRGAILAAAALGFSAPVAAEVTRSTDNSFVSRHEVVVEASAKEVWLALISPSGWWRKEHTWSGDAANLSLTPQAGGCFCETIPEVDEPGRFTLQGSVEHMRVIQAYPELALRMQGALGPLQSEPVVGVLTIAISKADDRTRIVWEYNVGGPMRYEVPVIAKAVDGVMGVQLAALAALLGPVTLADDDAAGAAEAEVAAPDEAPAADQAEPKINPAPIIKVVPTLRPGPTLKPAPTLIPAPAAKTGVAPAASPPGAVTTSPATMPAPKPAPKPAPTPAPKPAVKPAPKPSTVDDAFGDLTDDTPGR